VSAEGGAERVLRERISRSTAWETLFDEDGVGVYRKVTPE
jgi:hypothetical protein